MRARRVWPVIWRIEMKPEMKPEMMLIGESSPSKAAEAGAGAKVRIGVMGSSIETAKQKWKPRRKHVIFTGRRGENSSHRIEETMERRERRERLNLIFGLTSEASG